MKHIFLATALLALASCGAQTPVQQSDNSVKIAQAEVALTGAEKVALHYFQLPRCPIKKPVCADQATVNKIADADTAAYNALKAAKAVNSDANLAALVAALANLSGLLPPAT
jgi:hypothetical protein